MKSTSTGDCSTGVYSTGNCSTGNGSTGVCSTGHYSTGVRSTGDYSTGNCSTGNGSTGDYSTGNRSTGDYSTGRYSTGNWSSSSYSSGHFSTTDYSGFGAFNKPCTVDEWNNAYKPNFLFFSLTVWVPECDMSNQDKKNFSSHKTTGGYLKAMDYKEAFQEAYKGASNEDKEMLLKLPNFDADVFFEISGIDVRSHGLREEKKQELIAKAEELSQQAKELLSAAKDM